MKCRRAGGMQFLYIARGVTFVIHQNQGANATHLLIQGHQNRVKEISWAIRTRHGRIAHGTGKNYWCVILNQAIDDEGGFLEGISSLGDDAPTHAVI